MQRGFGKEGGEERQRKEGGPEKRSLSKGSSWDGGEVKKGLSSQPKWAS